ncbi:MAG: DNA repair protein RecN, partial [Christensenellales bacterium]
GASDAVVEAWFCDANEYVSDILQEQQIEPWDELVLSRELSASGKNVCRVNGTLTTLTVLKSISDRLVDIHGQHEHQSLLNEKNHIAMLDGFDTRIEAAKESVAAAYSEYTEAIRRRRALLGNDGDRERRIDILRFQIDEITKAGIASGEEEELLSQKARLNASERIMESLSAAYGVLYQAEPINALSALKDAAKRLDLLSDVDARYGDMSQSVNEAYYAMEEIASSIRGEMDEDFFDAGTLESVEERLALIAGLKRKYEDPAVTGSYIKNAERELDDLLRSGELLAELTQREAAIKANLYEKSLELSNMRRETAILFAGRMAGQLSDLGMGDARFSVEFERQADIESCSYTRNGIDAPKFYISANKGEPLKPLRKVASGGEVSRIMLALKNIAADKGGIPTMIFDEIDTGISGRIAQVVSEKLVDISRGRQVICVTHLPSIASMADRHFLVQKNSDEKSTRSTLVKLDYDMRVYEIARLAGGDTQLTRAHAKEMIEIANSYKSETRHI